LLRKRDKHYTSGTYNVANKTKISFDGTLKHNRRLASEEPNVPTLAPPMR